MLTLVIRTASRIVLLALFTLVLPLVACSSPPVTEDSAISPTPEAQAEPEVTASGITFPKPTGDHLVGTRHFEFVDRDYPSDRDGDADGRRLEVRVWYPAAEAHGERRPYFKGSEKEIYVGGFLDAFGQFVPAYTTLYEMEQITTHSYEDAPVATGIGDLPVLVYSHGGLGWTTQSTATMEELASHGYVVFSIGSPGVASGVLYPNGDHVPFDTEYLDGIFSMPPDPGDVTIEERRQYRESMLDNGGLGPWLPRLRDDLLALVDSLENKTYDQTIDDIVQLVDLDRLAYFGLSYGASAAMSAAHQDPRAKVAVNIDGTHHSSDLFGVDIRVPLLILTVEANESYSNAFHFERWETMGDREDILRVGIPGASHFEIFDNMFQPAEVRSQLPGAGNVDGMKLHQTLVGFTLAFFDKHLKGIENGYPEMTLERFPDIQQIDVSYIKDWATNGAIREAAEPEVTASGIIYPRPTGDHLVGTRHFEIVDRHYPVDRETDMDGRRLEVRVWYPAAEKHGERRPYYQGQEKEALPGSLVNAFAEYMPAISTLYNLEEITTHSYEDAPVAADIGTLPVLVYSHGAIGFTTMNTAIMEELASHGYVVFSVGSPGGASGVLYPNGDSVSVDPDFIEAVFFEPPEPTDASIEDFYQYRSSVLDTAALEAYQPRWRDDLLALVDSLENGTHPPTIDDIAQRIDLDQLAYWGLSYGASAAISAAHSDPRAKAAVNLDGTHRSSDLLGVDIRIPLLILTTEVDENYSNDFFFEQLETMGDREDILRVGLPGVAHAELMDNMFLPQEVRSGLPGAGNVDGMALHETLIGFTVAFFDKYLKGIENEYPETVLERFPDIQLIDVSHIKDWATNR